MSFQESLKQAAGWQQPGAGWLQRLRTRTLKFDRPVQTAVVIPDQRGRTLNRCLVRRTGRSAFAGQAN